LTIYSKKEKKGEKKKKANGLRTETRVVGAMRNLDTIALVLGACSRTIKFRTVPPS
jgi:hypothetical protein